MVNKTAIKLANYVILELYYHNDMTDLNISVIITSYKEPKTIQTAIKHMLSPNKDLLDSMELIIVAPDEKTRTSAKNELTKYQRLQNFKIIKDKGNGKPAALNIAYKNAVGKIFILTDGDVYIGHNSIKYLLRHFNNKKVGIVSGHPLSLDDRKTQFGYYSHLFCEAAHQKRLQESKIPASGYLYAFRNLKGIFPIPESTRAEDAYISSKVLSLGYQIKYEPDSLVYVKFPKNLSDWIKQKKRSLGGNIQTKKKQRTIVQDLKMAFFPIKFAENSKELWWSILLYPVRLFLWINIYIQHITNTYSKGRWERIESTK